MEKNSPRPIKTTTLVLGLAYVSMLSKAFWDVVGPML